MEKPVATVIRAKKDVEDHYRECEAPADPAHLGRV
jgi:hypothetical protein